MGTSLFFKRILCFVLLCSSTMFSQTETISANTEQNFIIRIGVGAAYFHSGHKDLYSEIDMKEGAGPFLFLLTGNRKTEYNLSFGYYSIRNNSNSTKYIYSLNAYEIGFGIRYRFVEATIYPYIGGGLSVNIYNLDNGDNTLQHGGRNKIKAFIDLNILAGIAYKLNELFTIDFNIKEGFLLSEAKFNKTIAGLALSFKL